MDLMTLWVSLLIPSEVLFLSNANIHASGLTYVPGLGLKISFIPSSNNRTNKEFPSHFSATKSMVFSIPNEMIRFLGEDSYLFYPSSMALSVITLMAPNPSSQFKNRFSLECANRRGWAGSQVYALLWRPASIWGQKCHLQDPAALESFNSVNIHANHSNMVKFRLANPKDFRAAVWGWGWSGAQGFRRTNKRIMMVA